MPRGSSRVSPCTGRREWPASRKTASTSASVACSATAVMSARGTMTSPTCTSCKARTFFNKARSCGETSSSGEASASASSMSSRIEASAMPNNARNRSNRLGFPPEADLAAPASLAAETSCSLIGAGRFLDQGDPVGVVNPETAEDGAFERLHRLGFGRLDMVVADKMQKSMHQKMGGVIAQWFSCFKGFPRGGLECDHDVAKKRRRGRIAPGGKRKHIGRDIMSAPFAVEFADEGVAAENNADLGVGGEHEAATLNRREDRRMGKGRGGFEGRPIPALDRDFDHGTHFRASRLAAPRTAAS